MKSITQGKDKYTHWFKAYLAETKNPDDPEDVISKTKVVFSNAPMSPSQFMPLFMGVAEAYAEELLTSNPPEAVYENFNSAFGIFLTKLVSEHEIYKRSKPHRKYKKKVDSFLAQPEDTKANEDNRMAAYLLAHDILTHEAGFTDESADLILTKRLGLLNPVRPVEPDNSQMKFNFQKEDGGDDVRS